MKVAIVEDNPKISMDLQNKLLHYPEIKVSQVSHNGKECLKALKENEDNLPDIILMDIQMPKMNGIETTQEVSQKYPSIHVVMLTVFDDNDHILQAIQAGAVGYLLKDEGIAYLTKTLQEVYDGYSQLSPAIARKVLNLMQTEKKTINPKMKAKMEQLTSREIEILQFLRKGLLYREIGDKLYIETSTVQKHIRNIYKKLQVNNRIQLLQATQGL